MKIIRSLLEESQHCTNDHEVLKLTEVSLETLLKEIKYSKSSPFNVLANPIVTIMIAQSKQLLTRCRSQSFLPLDNGLLALLPEARSLYKILTEITNTPLPFHPKCLAPRNPKSFSYGTHPMLQNNQLIIDLNFFQLLSKHAQDICPDGLFESMLERQSEGQKLVKQAHLLKQGYRFIIFYLVLKQAYNKLLILHKRLKAKLEGPQPLNCQKA